MKDSPLSSLAFVVLALGLTISLASWTVVNDGERETANLYYERAADDAITQITLRISSYEQLLRSAAALFAASDEVSREEWKIFYDSLQVEQNYPGVQGVAFARYLRAQELAAFETEVQHEGFPGFGIRPPGQHPYKAPVYFIEPFSGPNLRAFGYDMFTEPVRREAMQHGRDHHAMALSGKLRLVQETGATPQPGAILYFPVYRRHLALDTVEQRRQALLGFVACPFRMQDMMHAVLGDRARTMSLELFDGKQPAPEALLFSSASLSAAIRVEHDDVFRQLKHISIGGRTWTLRFKPLPAFRAANDGTRSKLILVGGIAFSMLSFWLLLSLTSVRSRALQLASQLSIAHRDSEARMRAIFDSTADAILSVTMDGTILAANRVAEEMFGFDAAELLGANTRKLAPACDHAWIDSIYASLAGTSWPRDYRREMTGLHKDGHTFPVQVSGTEVNIEGVQQLVMLIRDISHQQLAEANLRRSDILREALLNHAPFCILSTDLRGTITALNPAGERLVGYSAAELVGQQSVLVLSDPSERKIRARELSEKLGHPVNADFDALVARASLGLVDEGEWTAIRKDGSRVPVWAGVAAIRDENNEIFGYIGIVHDITQRKQDEATLATAKEQAEDANQAKSEFLANMSHEIRTPMNAVLGMAYLIGTEPLSPQQQGYLQMLNSSGRSLLGILNDILDFSKVEAGRMELSCAPFMLDEVIDSLASLMSVNTTHKDIEVAIYAPPLALRLNGDALRLQQTLINLVDNAIKFTVHGEVVLTIDLLDQQADKVKLRFCVRDTGIGMTPAQIERLFSPFSQADNSMTRRYGGTGLGLVISRRIVSLLGGDINVCSEPDRGSEFSFELEFELVQQKRSAEPVGADLRGLRLLAIGAHPALEQALKSCAETLDWSCRFVDSLPVGDTSDYDCLVGDWPADFAHGVNQLSAWSAYAASRRIPLLLALKGHLREHILQLPEMQFIASLLPKPVTRSALLSAISMARSKGMPSPSPAPPDDRPDLTGLRVLLAEDNAVNQLLTRRLLEQVGVSIDIVNDGQEAVDRLRQNPDRYDIILMDAQMPVMDGFTATRLLRGQMGLDLPIIALTAGVLKSERDNCLACGMNDFIPKPLDVKLLYSTLGHYQPKSGA